MNTILAQFFLNVRVGFFKATLVVSTINLLVAAEHWINVLSEQLPPYAVWR